MSQTRFWICESVKLEPVSSSQHVVPKGLIATPHTHLRLRTTFLLCTNKNTGEIEERKKQQQRREERIEWEWKERRRRSEFIVELR